MLNLTIKDGEGFTLGPDVVIRYDRDPVSRSMHVSIQAPRRLGVSRVDKTTALLLIDKLRRVTGVEARP